MTQPTCQSTEGGWLVILTGLVQWWSILIGALLIFVQQLGSIMLLLEQKWSLPY